MKTTRCRVIHESWWCCCLIDAACQKVPDDKDDDDERFGTAHRKESVGRTNSSVGSVGAHGGNGLVGSPVTPQYLKQIIIIEGSGRLALGGKSHHEPSRIARIIGWPSPRIPNPHPPAKVRPLLEASPCTRTLIKPESWQPQLLLHLLP